MTTPTLPVPAVTTPGLPSPPPASPTSLLSPTSATPWDALFTASTPPSAPPLASATPSAAGGAAAAPDATPTAVLEAVANTADSMRQQLPSLVEALAVLLIGWLLAVVLARTTRRVLGRAGLDERAVRWLGAGPDGQPRPLSYWLGQLVFAILLLFTLAAFFERAGFSRLAAPLAAITDRILAALPGAVLALVLALVAWLVAAGVRFLIERSASVTRLDERLGQPDVAEEGVSVSRSLALGAQAVVYLVFLPAILNLLGLQALAQPIESALVAVVAFIPNVLGAGAILLATWFVARVVRQIVIGLAVAVGVDRRAAVYGVQDVKLADALATAVAALVALPGLVLALNALGIPAISDPVNAIVAQFLARLPSYLVAAVMLVIAYYVAKIAAQVTATVLTGIGFNHWPARLGLKVDDLPGQSTPAEVVGLVVQVTIVLLTAVLASQQAGSTGLTAVLTGLVSFGARVLLAGVILLVGVYFGNLTYAVVVRSVGLGRRGLAVMAQAAVMIFAIAIALTEVGVAQSIVTTAFLGLVLAVGGAVALAVGLGGRKLAGQMLSEEYRRLRGTPPDLPTAPPYPVAGAPDEADPMEAAPGEAAASTGSPGPPLA